MNEICETNTNDAEGGKMKRVIVLLLVIVMLCVLISACATVSKIGEDFSPVEQNEQKIAGISLGNDPVVILVDSETDEMHFSQDALITNTTQITVSAETIPEKADIEVYLFFTEDTEQYIAAASLSGDNVSVEFTNLTSAESYIVGVKGIKACDSIRVTITD